MIKVNFFVVFLFFLTGCSESLYDLNGKEQQEVLASAISDVTHSDTQKQLAGNNIIWHWENRFEKEEVYKIKKWLGEIDNAIVSSFGKYPFDVHFFVHRAKSGNEPVPWAHTTRGKDQGVHLHVNTNFSLDEFLNDWTAQHEISHLSIPFVGKENSWFSEGYATYMQVQVMNKQGVMTNAEVDKKYALKLLNCKKAFQSNLPLPEAADSLKNAWNYPAMYWGGVSFFWKLNRAYKENEGYSLVQVINQYVSCCRVDDSSPTAICKSFDEVTKTSHASKLLLDYQKQPARLMFEEF
ncbi:MAG: hypothetical protein ACPGD5_05585 [Salibacteraceae bacterium]